MEVKIKVVVPTEEIEKHNKECEETEEEHRKIKTQKELFERVKEVIEDFGLSSESNIKVSEL